MEGNGTEKNLELAKKYLRDARIAGYDSYEVMLALNRIAEEE